jgi:tetratricopeptide (TPR) repeat protein
MLDLSELHAHEAVTKASETEAISALENMSLVQETRGRAAWEEGDSALAEHYYSSLVELDGLASKARVRLADFLAAQGRREEAVHYYREAAILGAPWTLYARAQIAKLSNQPS